MVGVWTGLYLVAIAFVPLLLKGGEDEPTLGQGAAWFAVCLALGATTLALTWVALRWMTRHAPWRPVPTQV